jgi:hypothetical protein
MNKAGARLPNPNGVNAIWWQVLRPLDGERAQDKPARRPLKSIRKVQASGMPLLPLSRW